MYNQPTPEVANFFRVIKPNQIDAAIKEADALVNRSVRNHDHISEDRIQQWRGAGMLDDTDPGSWEETTLACVLENQRVMKEC